ncbi:hypothetical protein [Salininema proteolyticum]|uniref:Protein ImuA n=1 Tax=Salininema proteolyticum TaxID=1607685 RepID=A0ABV8U0Q7_9ACTN
MGLSPHSPDLREDAKRPSSRELADRFGLLQARELLIGTRMTERLGERAADPNRRGGGRADAAAPEDPSAGWTARGADGLPPVGQKRADTVEPPAASSPGIGADMLPSPAPGEVPPPLRAAAAGRPPLDAPPAPATPKPKDAGFAHLAPVRPQSWTAVRPTLPVTPDIAALLPDRALTGFLSLDASRPGTTSLLWRLLAGPTAGGVWCALLSLPRLHPNAAAAAGVDLARVARVEADPALLADAAGTLAEGVGVLVLPARALAPAALRRLAGRARRRGCTVVLWGDRPRAGTEVSWSVREAEWFGLPEDGNRGRRFGPGLIRGCSLTVAARIKGGRTVERTLWPYGRRREAA